MVEVWRLPLLCWNVHVVGDAWMPCRAVSPEFTPLSMTTQRHRLPGMIMGLVLCAACGASIHRSGYSVPDALSAPTCKIAVQEYRKLGEEGVTVLGRVRVRDTGFSVQCSESLVLERLRQEGCYLGADLINLTEVHPPDGWSTCFRTDAEFVRFDDRARPKTLVSDPQYDFDVPDRLKPIDRHAPTVTK